MILETFVFVCALTWILKYLRYQSKWNHIPGYSGWNSLPFIGHMHYVGKEPVERLNECNKKFGDIFRLDAGPWPTVWLCNYKEITEAMKKDVFSDRPYHLNFPGVFRTSLNEYDKHGEAYGLALANGKRWTEQRGFFSKYLSASKHTFDDVISEEIFLLCNKISKTVGQNNGTLQISGLFLEPSVGIVWNLLTGQNLLKKEKKEMLVNTVRKVFAVMDRPKNISSLLQYMTPLGTLLKQLGFKTIFDIGDFADDYIIKEINALNPSYDGSYIEQHKEKTLTVDNTSSFSGQEGFKNLKGSVVSVIIAGTDTIATYLEWFVVYMASFPDIQEKCFQEVQSVFDGGRPSMADGKSTPFLRATIQEISRHCPHLAITVQHLTTQDVYVGDTLIPKGTAINYFSGAVMHDPDYFKDPSTFNPSRFIGPNGEYLQDERVIYFGTGKRRCVGEVLARVEQYLFCASLIQNFKFMLPADVGQQSFKDYTAGLNMYPKQVSFQVEERKNYYRRTC